MDPIAAYPPYAPEDSIPHLCPCAREPEAGNSSAVIFPGILRLTSAELWISAAAVNARLDSTPCANLPVYGLAMLPVLLSRYRSPQALLEA